MHTILTAPTFEDRRPPRDALVWRVTLSPDRAFRLICDIGHLYPSHLQRPRVGAMLEMSGAWAVYLWPRTEPDSRLLLLLMDYGAARRCDLDRWHGQTWLTGDLLCRVLAALAFRSAVQQRQVAA
jgi:hypothetical protein